MVVYQVCSRADGKECSYDTYSTYERAKKDVDEFSKMWEFEIWYVKAVTVLE